MSEPSTVSESLKEKLPTLLKTKTKFIVPNFITASSLVLGMVSIFSSFNHEYVLAAWMTLFSTVLDKLDGSTARALNASSEFGVQLDSFSDFISFGVAPAVLIYSLCTGHPLVSEYFAQPNERLFMTVAVVIMVVTSAMRLARFNVTTTPEGHYMIGLATTAVGGLVASFTLTGLKYVDSTLFGSHLFAWMLSLLPYMVVIFSLLMISPLPMKKVGYKVSRRGKIAELGVMVLVLLLIIFRALPEIIFLSGLSFVVIGFWDCLRNREQVRKELNQAGVELEIDEEVTEDCPYEDLTDEQQPTKAPKE